MAMKPDTGLEDDAQLAAAYRAGSQEQPPAALDAAIRAAARREVGAGPAGRAVKPVRAWGVPLSLAAVVVLSVTVVLMMQEEGADRLDPTARPVPAEVAPPAAERDVPNKAVGSAEVQESAPSPRPSPAEAARPPVPVPARIAPVPASPQQARTAESEPRPAAAPPLRAKAAADVASREDAAEIRREQSTPAAPQALMRSAPASAAGEVTAGAGSAARTPDSMRALADAPEKAALWRDLTDAPPEKWLQRAAELRRAGKTADATAVLAEFRRRFPAERVPEELR